MCIFGGGSSKATKVVNQTVPEPEKTAQATEVGTARKQEDQDLFGGVPDLRVDRNTAPAGVASSGSGLNLM